MQPKKENNYFVRQKMRKYHLHQRYILLLRILFLQCINSEAKQPDDGVVTVLTWGETVGVSTQKNKHLQVSSQWK